MGARDRSVGDPKLLDPADSLVKIGNRHGSPLLLWRTIKNRKMSDEV